MPPIHTEYVPKKPRRRMQWRWLAAALFAVTIFAGGVLIGRGNLHVRYLSVNLTSANSSGLNYSSVNQVYGILKANFDGSLDSTKLINGAKQGLVSAAGDPYTDFFDPASAKVFNDELSGSITGIGAQLGSDSSGNIEIIAPLSGYPAAKAGLEPKDLVVGINGVSTSGMSVDTAVSKIRGAAGTKVTLTIVRAGGNPFNMTITREKITVPSVEWHEDGAIGYLKVSQFTTDTDGLAQKAVSEFQSKGVKAIVLDLRGDPGGYLSDAVNISSYWLDQGKTVVSERRGSTIIDTQYSTGNNALHGLPTVVLIDAGSASASEITAGALHDNGVATLVGQKSFGKGSVQEVKNLPDGSELKVTIAHWYTPNGKNINKQGITPDVVVSNQGAASGTDPQLAKAEQILNSKIK